MDNCREIEIQILEDLVEFDHVVRIVPKKTYRIEVEITDVRKGKPKVFLPGDE